MSSFITIHMKQKNLDKLMAELCPLASDLESKKARKDVERQAGQALVWKLTSQ